MHARRNMIMYPKLWSQDTKIKYELCQRKNPVNARENKWNIRTNQEKLKIVTLNTNRELIKYQVDRHHKRKIITKTNERGFLGLHINANGWRTPATIRTTIAKIALRSIQRFKDLSPKNKKALCICRSCIHASHGRLNQTQSKLKCRWFKTVE